LNLLNNDHATCLFEFKQVILACMCNMEMGVYIKTFGFSNLQPSSSFFGLARSTMATWKKDWQYSQAKKLLVFDLTNGTIPLYSSVMGPQEVYQLCPEFKQYEFNCFRDRLWDLCKKLSEKNDHSASDSMALAHHCRIHPTPTHNHRGEPWWEGSKSEQLLKLDIDHNKQQAMEPKDLFATQQEYGKYDLKVFCKHIYQEEGWCKFIAQCTATRQKKQKSWASR